MIFIEGWYLLFLVVSLPALWLASPPYRPFLLLAACAVFHWHYAGPAGVAPILLLSALTFSVLRYTESERRAKKPLILACIAVCIAALITYRYLGIWAVPLAISFFTFEFLHLLADRFTGRLSEPISVGDFLLFIFFFPSLAAGPIKRYENFKPQFPKLGWPGWSVACSSAMRILFGFFKKLVIVTWLEALTPGTTRLNIYDSTLKYGFFIYLTLYLDLSAYSDIAIGTAGLLGIKVPENLNFIPGANSFQSYWGRWHISVTNWFKDYVFYPLARLHRGRVALCSALLFTLALSGLWHGPHFHFVLWGLFNGAGILGEIALSRWIESRGWTPFFETWPVRIGQWFMFQWLLLIEALLFLYPLSDFLYQLSKDGIF